ncbi:nipped-B-like protein A [Photinus pyralis]|uniref:nipped-B-like protein A n=1 Tax=Photinus pyralis TaxID=7054 RepID=UPI0012677CB0|nr:nipped-B-like protein A [Photinus pyralis]
MASSKNLQDRLIELILKEDFAGPVENPNDKTNAPTSTPPDKFVKLTMRKVGMKLVPVLEKVPLEGIMERFNRSVELIAEDPEPSDELVRELMMSTSVLKNLKVTSSIHVDKLLRVLHFVELKMQKADHVSVRSERDTRLVMTAADSCLVALFIMTSPKMPKRVYLEDVIDKVVSFIKFQLHSSVFPEFDCTLKAQVNRVKKSPQAAKICAPLYNKIIKLVHLLAELIEIQVLTDSLLVDVSSVALPTFFVQNVAELQSACLTLALNISARYESQRTVFLNDILTSTVWLPVTKRGLLKYELREGGDIQIMTALVLQLIQSAPGLSSEASARKITDGYKKATSLAQTFLATFLSSCVSKSKDYSNLFESFLQDLWLTVGKPDWPAAALLLNILGKILVKHLLDKNVEVAVRILCLDYLSLIVTRTIRDSAVGNAKITKLGQLIKDTKQSEAESIECLQFLLLDYLALTAQEHKTIMYVRHFYIAQWYTDLNGPSAQKHKGYFENKMKRLSIPPYSTINYNKAETISKYLASKHTTNTSSDQYLKAIVLVRSDASMALRTKVLKCLAKILTADPSLLECHDVQKAINSSFLDQSASVREMALDLISQIVVCKLQFVTKYYEMLSARILDSAVSVRKRVIKIFRDICVELPNLPCAAEICLKIVRRVNDEEGVQKLVVEVFRSIWFTSLAFTSLAKIVSKITDVVAISKQVELGYLERVLCMLLQPSAKPSNDLLLTAQQIVDSLIGTVSDFENNPQRAAISLTTCSLFAKVRPELLVEHANILLSCLSLRSQSNEATLVIIQAIKILELIVPLIDRTNKNFLDELEADCMNLILQRDRAIVATCLSCFGCLLNNVTRNFKLVRDLFHSYYTYLSQIKTWMCNENRDDALADPKRRQYFRRALFTVGLLLRHFDFKNPEVRGELEHNVEQSVFELFAFFLTCCDQDTQANTLKAVGYICIRNCEFMLSDDLKSVYLRILATENAPLDMKSEVLNNIEMYLLAEEEQMMRHDLEWARQSKRESLKEMHDVSSGMASTIIQSYLKEILRGYLHPSVQVRLPSIRVIQLVLRQGLVHPIHMVPYLICMSTDCELTFSQSADKQLQDLERRYPGLVHSKSSIGINLSYELQKTLQKSSTLVRGFREVKDEHPVALNGFLYSIIRHSRQQRRALVKNMLKQFDEELHVPLSFLLFLADNLAYFSYVVEDEILFLVHHIDVVVSLAGGNILQSFKKGLTGGHEFNNNSVCSIEDDDDNEAKVLAEHMPENTSHLEDCLSAAQGCLLLLSLKQHLKDLYGITDGTIHEYSQHLKDLYGITDGTIHE